ncbi:MAG: hypothetical protein GYB31_19870 [Bacteroidetes bacterium]|nr:hypothetical protein [Bacteroidota bacterium]
MSSFPDFELDKNSLSAKAKLSTLAINQVAEYKPRMHRAYLQQWLQTNRPELDFEAVWTWREACIAAL